VVVDDSIAFFVGFSQIIWRGSIALFSFPLELGNFGIAELGMSRLLLRRL
jgi:hypothetical protein